MFLQCSAVLQQNEKEDGFLNSLRERERKRKGGRKKIEDEELTRQMFGRRQD